MLDECPHGVRSVSATYEIGAATQEFAQRPNANDQAVRVTRLRTSRCVQQCLAGVARHGALVMHRHDRRVVSQDVCELGLAAL